MHKCRVVLPVVFKMSSTWNTAVFAKLLAPVRTDILAAGSTGPHRVSMRLSYKGSHAFDTCHSFVGSEFERVWTS